MSAPYTRLWRCEGVAGGAPCLRTTGILVRFVADRFAAGETPLAIADDYGVPEATILEAIRFGGDITGRRLTSQAAAARIARLLPVTRRRA